MSNKHDQEEEYFARLDREKTEALRKELEAQKAAEAAKTRKDTHFMHCGKCGGDLATHVFRGVEIEICPDCGAVLLDSGELEKLAGKDEGSAMGFLGDLFSFRKK